MNDFRKTLKRNDHAIIFGLMVSVSLVGAFPETVSAQGRLKSETVTVDFSALNGASSSGISSSMAINGMGFGQNIMAPPVRMPQSTYYLGPVSNNFTVNNNQQSTPILSPPPLVAKASVLDSASPEEPVLTQPELAVQMPETIKVEAVIEPPVEMVTEAPAEPEITAPVLLAVSEPEVAPSPPPAPVIEVTEEPSEPIMTAEAPPAAPEPETMAVTSPPPPAPEVATKQIDEPEGETSSQASLTPGEIPSGPGQSLLLEFAPSEAKVTPEAKADLSALAALIKDDKELRLQLMAYAGGEEITAGKARRLSLSRALSIRSFLIENGIRSTRIDVRALGNKTSKDPINRVDVKVTKR